MKKIVLSILFIASCLTITPQAHAGFLDYVPQGVKNVAAVAIKPQGQIRQGLYTFGSTVTNVASISNAYANQYQSILIPLAAFVFSGLLGFGCGYIVVKLIDQSQSTDYSDATK